MSAKISEKIYTDLLIMMSIYLFLDSRIYMVLSFAYLCILIARKRFKFYIPKIQSIKLYLFFLFYAILIGFLFNETRSVLRDIYYIVPTLIWLFIGYYKSNGLDKSCTDKCLNTVFIFGGIISARAIITFLINPIISFTNLRGIFGLNVYDIGFVLPILITEKYIYKNVIFTKKFDMTLIAIMSVQALFCFGRMGLLEVFLEMGIIFTFTSIYANNSIKIVGRVLKITTLITLIFIGLIQLLPSSMVSNFIEKVLKSTEEVNASQVISSYSSAINNWRAYEMQQAILQWKNSSLLVKIFGAGLGKGIEVNYIPSEFYFVENNEIPLLHNSFLTLLPKGGLYGMVSLIVIFVGNAFCAFKNICKRRNIKNSIYLLGICVAGFANTYVVRGPVQQGTFLVWAFLTSVLCKRIHK